MSIFSSIHSFLLSPVPRPENRSREQIERDLEDEFAFHLEMKARSLMADDGLEREAASGAAREKFGDVEAVKNQCRRIALKEQVMLQRVNFIMMALVMLMVVAVGVQVLITQRHNTQALQAITAEITNMKYDALAAQRGGGAGISPAVVYLDGDVARPGVFSMPIAGALTLRRAITAAGGANRHDAVKVVVRSDDGSGNSSVRYTADRFALTGDDENDFRLAPNDHVTVTSIGETSGQVPASRDARAKAVGDFVLQLFAAADPNDPNIDQTIRKILDETERDLDVKYKDDPATAGMIRELIASRRKIFDADAAIQQAATAEAKTKAVTDFLDNMLASVDAHASNTVSVSEVLDNASQGIDEKFADNPELAALMHQRLADAKAQIAAQRDAADAKSQATTNAVTPDKAGDDPATDGAKPDHEGDDAAHNRDNDPGEVRQDDDFPKLSPFLAVRWKDQWTPIVNFNGGWYELKSIDGREARTIVEHCRRRHGDEHARKRFSEDLAQMLIEMGFPPANDGAVKLQIKDMRSGTLLAVNQAKMTSENRERIVAENRAAENAGAVYPLWKGTE